jgi:hypothetical protein
MATEETYRFYSDANKMHICERKRRKLMKIFNWNINIVLVLTFLIQTTCAQYPGQNPLIGDRDPRFYSRPGVDYHLQNPGDKDYR